MSPDRDPSIVVRCDRFDALLSRLACGLRYLAGRQTFALVPYRGCRGCATGQECARFVPRRMRRVRRASDMFRALETARNPRRRDVLPLYEERSR